MEERNGSGCVIKQYVWGERYMDELLQVAINDDPSDEAEQDCETTYYALQDANYNVIGLTDANGTLVERYEYSPYGLRTVFRSYGSNDPLVMAPVFESQQVTADSVGQPYGLCDIGHQGLYHDKEFQLVYNRARYLSPRLRRFLQRDPLGYIDGPSLYEYVRSNPVNAVDPFGLEEGSCISGIVRDISSFASDVGRYFTDYNFRNNFSRAYNDDVAKNAGRRAEAFAKGVAQGLSNTAKGAWDAVRNPQQIIDSLRELIKDPQLLADMLEAMINEIREAAGNDDAKFAKLMGRYYGEFAAAALAGSGAAKIAQKLSGLSKAGRIAALRKLLKSKIGKKLENIAKKAGTKADDVNSAYRYVSEGEAKVAQETGQIPNTTMKGDPKNVSVTPERYTSVSDAEAKLQIGSQDPRGPQPSPTHRVEVDMSGTTTNYAGNSATGGGVEIRTPNSPKVISVQPLDK